MHALAFLATQQAIAGHAHVVEEQLGGVLGLQAHLVEHAADAVARQVLGFDHEDGQSAPRSSAVGAHHQHHRPASQPLVMKIFEPLTT